MALADALAAGAGMNVAGGLIGALGNQRRNRAFQDALGQSKAAVRGRGQAQTASRGRLNDQFVDLGGRRDAALDDLLESLGPGQQQALAAGQEQADTELAAAGDEIMGMLTPRQDFAQTGAGTGVGVAAARREAARAAPRQDLRRFGLSQALSAIPRAEAESEFQDRLAELARVGDEAGRDFDLRSALIDRTFGVQSQAARDALVRAMRAGGLESALMGGLQGLSPGIAAILATRQPAPTTGQAAGPFADSNPIPFTDGAPASPAISPTLPPARRAVASAL